MGSKKSHKDLSKNVEDVFYYSGRTKRHEHLIKRLKTIYAQSVLEEFLADYINCLQICFLNPEKISNVEYALDFAAKFAVSLSENLGEDETCPFLNGVFEFLLENHECDDDVARFHVCHFIYRLLEKMPDNATIEDALFSTISWSMLGRFRNDKMASVRAEAVCALYRLQTDRNITSVFRRYLIWDPSYEVRIAIVQKIAINKKSLHAVLICLDDTEDVLRKEAYKRLHNLSIKDFTNLQRQTILEKGLNDKFEMARLFVTNTLIPSWLKAFDDNYLEFVKAINVESLPKVTISVLQAMFKQQQVVTLPSLMRQMNIVDKVVPLSKLCSETVLFWRAMAEYLKPNDTEKEEDTDKYFEIVLPDLTQFTLYILQYRFFSSLRTSEFENPGDFVLCQLLQIAKIYDYSDEMGRGCLKQLCIDLLKSRKISVEATTIAVDILNSVIPEPNTRINVMTKLISELKKSLCSPNSCEAEIDVLAGDGRSTKNDSEILRKIYIMATSVIEPDPTFNDFSLIDIFTTLRPWRYNNEDTDDETDEEYEQLSQKPVEETPTVEETVEPTPSKRCLAFDTTVIHRQSPWLKRRITSTTKIKTERSRKKVKIATAAKSPVLRRTTRSSLMPEQEPSRLQKTAEKKSEEVPNNEDICFCGSTHG